MRATERHFASPPQGKHRAFTLVELLVVLAILAIVTVIAVPRFSNSTARYRLDAAADRVAADLRLARSHARSGAAAITVSFDPVGNLYTLSGLDSLDHSHVEYRVALASDFQGVDMTAADFGGDAELVFDGYGVADTDGSVALQSGAGTRLIKLFAGVEEVTIQ